ncbi:hypothetical protein LL036_17950 [Clostridium sp. CF011]|uniref:hypothetical protein n=1 Tax=Clostridium sp. CF011 TaxID=2843318 RepID=UPI00227C2857|nr:hypothetical protein [Clostridium sp. CF011]WAG69821.1 hypothetical protein LL036_17950 [Clostridium sp. CF011]
MYNFNHLNYSKAIFSIKDLYIVDTYLKTAPKDQSENWHHFCYIYVIASISCTNKYKKGVNYEV